MAWLINALIGIAGAAVLATTLVAVYYTFAAIKDMNNAPNLQTKQLKKGCMLIGMAVTVLGIGLLALLLAQAYIFMAVCFVLATCLMASGLYYKKAGV